MPTLPALLPPRAAAEVKHFIRHNAIRNMRRAHEEASKASGSYYPDSDGGSDGVSDCRGVGLGRQLTPAMRAGFVRPVVKGTERHPVPAAFAQLPDAPPIRVAPGVYAGSARWARDHHWLARHRVRTLINVGLRTRPRGRAAARTTYHLPLEVLDRPLAQCSRSLDPIAVREIGEMIADARNGIPTVRGVHEDAGTSVLLFCATGQVARLAAVAALLTCFPNARPHRAALCAVARCEPWRDNHRGPSPVCGVGRLPVEAHVHIATTVPCKRAPKRG